MPENDQRVIFHGQHNWNTADLLRFTDALGQGWKETPGPDVESHAKAIIVRNGIPYCFGWKHVAGVAASWAGPIVVEGTPPPARTRLKLAPLRALFVDVDQVIS